MKKKLLALLLALSMITALCAACGSESTSSTSTETSQTASAEESPATTEAAASQSPSAAPTTTTALEDSAAEEASAEESTVDEVSYDSMAEKYFAMSNETNKEYEDLQSGVKSDISYPLDGSNELSIWQTFSAFIWSGLMESYADAPMMPIFEEKTGVHMNFIEVSDSASSEQFNLMIASGDYTDLLSMNSYTGGVEAGLEDDIIVDLTDMVKDDMPNYQALIDTLDDYTLKSVYSDGDKILQICNIVSNSVSEQGLSYRKDWADEFGIDAIETVDDMFDYLSAVKDKYNCTYPIFIDNSGNLEGFTGAFGTAGVNLGYTDLGMMVDDGNKLVSSMTDERFRSYLEAFHKFYAAGLIKDNFYNESYGPDYINSYVSNDQCAVTSIRGDKFPTMTETAISSSFDFEALAPLVENAGDTYKFNMRTSRIGRGGLSVSSKCEDPDLALKYMNWFFTEEGYMAGNYGEEGVCFEYNEDGDPVYTEFIVNNPDGYNTMNLRNMYTNPIFPMYTNATAVFYTYDEVELGAFDIWNNSGTDECSLPTLTFTTEETSDYASIATTVYTYASEQILKWMIGEDELTDESWNNYVDQCNTMGLPDAVEIYQGVFDRMYPDGV